MDAQTTAAKQTRPGGGDIRGERYRAMVANASQVRHDLFIVRTLGGDVCHALHPRDAEILFACREFASLDVHADQVARKRWVRAVNGSAKRSLIQRALGFFVQSADANGAGMRLPGTDEVLNRLHEFAEQGLLLSESELRASILRNGTRTGPATPPGVKITQICIPTRGRPALLNRALSSYAENAERSGRACAFLVIDDARRCERSSRDAVAEFARRAGSEIRYSDRALRENFASTLADVAGVNVETVRFALLGDEDAPVTAGGCRNAMLLASVGRPIVSVDDDSLCSVRAVTGASGRVALASALPGMYHRFYETEEEAAGDMPAGEIDFLDIHEGALGKSVSEVLEPLQTPADLVVERISPQFSSVLADGISHRVAVTMAGILGEAGSDRNIYRLLSPDAFPAEAWQSEDTYKSALYSRYIYIAAPAVSLSDAPICMAGNLGLDNRSPLPPFLPVHRNEDGVFIHVLRKSFPATVAAHLPYALGHLPEAAGQRRNSDPWQVLRRQRAPDLLIQLIKMFRWNPVAGEEARNMETLGAYLIDLAGHNHRAFDSMLHAASCEDAAAQFRIIEERLGEGPSRPEFYRRDLQRFAQVLREAVADPDWVLPVEIPGTAEEKRAGMRSLVLRYGRLLAAWPSLVNAAKELEDSEQHRLSTGG